MTLRLFCIYLFSGLLTLMFAWIIGKFMGFLADLIGDQLRIKNKIARRVVAYLCAISFAIIAVILCVYIGYFVVTMAIILY